MADLAVLDGRSIELAGLSLDELADLANREQVVALSHAAAAVAAAIRCGEALIEAKTQVGRGNWVRWIDEHLDMKPATVNAYVRLATFKRELEGAEGLTSVEKALIYLREIGAPNADRSGPPRHLVPEEVVEEAKRLRREGVGLNRVAELVGISRQVLEARLDPAGVRKRRSLYARRARARRKAAAEALAREEQDRAVRRHGGSAATAYSSLRKLTVDLDQAVVECTDEEARGALRLARTFAQKATDEIWRAVQLG